MKTIYALESRYLLSLLDNRRELLAVARTLGTAEAMRAAREELLASASVNLAPKAGADQSKLYAIDDECAAHINIVGQLTPKADTDACGAYTASALTEYGYIIAATRAADTDPKVEKIVFDTDSPGGYVSGVDEVAQVMASAQKPTEARVYGMAASAAYWLTSQADRIVAMTPAAQIGSIGIAAEEYDDDEALAREGVSHRVYTSTAAPDKRPDTKTDEGRAKIIAELDALHSVFASRVAEGRGVSIEKVNADFGHGGILIASAALTAGMIDEVRGVSISRRNKPGVAGEKASAENAANFTSKEGSMENMTLDKLKAESPDVYKAAFDEGMKAERTRYEGINAFRGKNEKGDSVVAEMIANGKPVADAMPVIMSAILDGNKADSDGDNAPDVHGKTPANAAGVVDNGLTAEDASWAIAHGMTPEEFAKFSRKEGE